MGGCSVFMVVDGYQTNQQLEHKFYYRQQLERQYYGDSPYNGSMSTFNGIHITNLEFQDIRTGQQYILNNSKQWGQAIAVKVVTQSNHYWLIGGWAAS